MKPSFQIGHAGVGGDAPVFIVAELSANHGGSLDRALRTIEMAAKVGANAIKLQTYTPDTLTLRSSAPPFVVNTTNEWAGRTLHDLFAEAMTPWEWHAELKAAAEAAGLVVFSTPFDPTATELLARLDMPAYKIASFELVDLPLVEHVARRGKPVIMSTGMASLGEIEAAVRVCREAGNDRLALLRCVSAYPARPEAMHLESLDVLRSFGVVVGLSDHTRDETVAIAAVALGAKIIEKHFILNRDVGGPDAFFSLEPDDFKRMVSAVREAEAALGAPTFGAGPDERASVAFRRSLFVARDVPEGAVLTCDDVRSVRPSHGIDPRHLPSVLGRTARRALAAATPLTWDAVGPAPKRAGIDLRLDEAVADGFVASFQGTRIGRACLERRGGDSWELRISLEPGAPEDGLAAALISAMEVPARERGAVHLSARVRADEAAMVRAFKSAGYYAFVERRVGDEACLFCERRIVPYADPA